MEFKLVVLLVTLHMQMQKNNPDGHKSYAKSFNSGHTFVSIEEYFTLDPDAGWVNKNPRDNNNRPDGF